MKPAAVAECVQVMVRCRPMSDSEKTKSKMCVMIEKEIN